MRNMKAVVIHQAGGPEVLNVEERPIPAPKPDWILIRVRAFGLNRSELFTRQGHSPNVRFPRVLGIEAVGEVVEAPDGGFAPGDKVATAMGGMGRAFDGGYAESTLVPAFWHNMPRRTLQGWPLSPLRGSFFYLSILVEVHFKTMILIQHPVSSQACFGST